MRVARGELDDRRRARGANVARDGPASDDGRRGRVVVEEREVVLALSRRDARPRVRVSRPKHAAIIVEAAVAELVGSPRHALRRRLAVGALRHGDAPVAHEHRCLRSREGRGDEPGARAKVGRLSAASEQVRVAQPGHGERRVDNRDDERLGILPITAVLGAQSIVLGVDRDPLAHASAFTPRIAWCTEREVLINVPLGQDGRPRRVEGETDYNLVARAVHAVRIVWIANGR